MSADHQPVAEDQPQINHQPVDIGPASTASVGSALTLAVSWDDVCYSVKEGKETKQILRGLTGCALPGRTLAIMGSSGAGKTTFLNGLSDRLARGGGAHLSGQLYFNNMKYDRKYRKLMAFVTQDDIIASMSTPEDAFRFSLRIRRGTNPEETKARVAEMIEEMNLYAAKDTIVGIPGVITGLSGGERKRCNIGVELIGDPKVLLLDEPTSGLDSVTAAHICRVCKEMAERGRTIIFTIHQPTAECIETFDDLMLMSAGKVAYHGTMAGAVPYFERIGYPCPENFTPTDFFMTLLQDPDISPILLEKWDANVSGAGSNVSPHLVASPQAISGKNRQDAYATFERLAAAGSLGRSDDDSETRAYCDKYVARTGSSTAIQFTELFNRAFTNVRRNKMFIMMSILQGVFFAIVAGLIFVNLKDSTQGIQDRMGLLFMVVANRGFGGTMMMIQTFPPEKALFIREQQAGAYSTTIYFFAKILAELPVQVLSALLESVIIYWMTGLDPTAGHFFYYALVVFSVFQATAGLGLFISCVVPSFQLASGLAPLCMIPMMLAGGLLGSVDRLRPAWIWLEKLSVIRYGYVLLMKNEFEGNDTYFRCNSNEFDSPRVNGTVFCALQPKTGDQVLSEFKLVGVDHSEWLMWVCLVCWIIFMRFFAVMALYRTGRVAK